jgi:hypothetical protein
METTQALSLMKGTELEPSFGNKNLGDNMTAVVQALKKTEYLEKSFGRRNTPFYFATFGMSSFFIPQNIKRCSEEISSRKAALTEAMHKLNIRRAKLAKLENELARSSPLDADILQSKMMLMKQRSEASKQYIEGAMKDILLLTAYHDQLVAQVQDYDEAKFEETEIAFRIAEQLLNAMRDIRSQLRCIGQGCQEALENYGLNPNKIAVACIGFINAADVADPAQVSYSQEQEIFVKNLAYELVPLARARIKQSGLNYDMTVLKDFLYHHPAEPEAK